MVRISEPKKLIEIAKAIDATVEGDPNCLIYGLATLEGAKAGDVSFLSNPIYAKYLASTQASAVILSPDHLKRCRTNALVMKDPRLGFAQMVRLFGLLRSEQPGVHPTAVIAEGVSIPSSATIGSHVTIGRGVQLGEHVVIKSGCHIGEDCTLGSSVVLHSNVVLYSRVTLGSRSHVHSGTVIGCDGFGFTLDGENWIKLPHVGGVRVGEDVDIGANTCIDRGVLEDTIIGNNVIIDNLVQIAHNVIIGDHTAIAGCAAIAGSTTIGRYCLIGGGTSISGHLSIADRVSITGTSAVSHSISECGIYSSGLPAKPNSQWKRNVARFGQLDELAKRLNQLERKMKQLIGESKAL